MKVPLQISFKNLASSEAIRARIEQRVMGLERYFQPIISCRVAIEAPHRHHRRGNHYHVRVDLRVPGGQIVVSRSRDLHHAHKDVYVAIRDVFDEVRRRLEDFARQQWREFGVSAGYSHGHVLRVIFESGGGGYGFIESDDGREIYFNSRSVLNHQFGRIQVGDRIAYTEEAGTQGPQASSVELVHSVSKLKGRRAA